MKILFIAIAGAVGTLTRYYLGGFVQRLSGSSAFPWGTFSVNMLGCLLFGFIWTLAEERFVISPQARTIILVGFMGALTTFSTFIFDTGSLLRGSQLALAIGNIAVQNVTGLIFLFLGIAAGRLI